MAVYKLSSYPKTMELRDGASVVVRPMAKEDGPALLEFFHRIPDDERFLLKDDVTSPAVIEAWCTKMDYDRALPLLAFDGDQIVADVTLIRQRSGARSQVAEIRALIDPVYRRWGLGVTLMRELIEIAYDAELEQVFFELVEGSQDDAIKAAEFLGAVQAGRVVDFFKDREGRPRDAVFLSVPLGKWWEWSRF